MARNSDKIDFSRVTHEIKQHWYVYLITFIVITGICGAYWLIKSPVYAFHAKLIVEQDESSTPGGGLDQMMQVFALGGGSSVSVQDEVLVLQSRSLMTDVIATLGLNSEYTEKQGMKNIPLYKNSAVHLDIPQSVLDTLQEGFEVKVKTHNNGTVDVAVEGGMFADDMFNVKNAHLPVNVKIPAGSFQLSATDLYNAKEEKDIKITVTGTNELVETYLESVVIYVESLKTNSIILEYEDNNIQRGKDILNTLISHFNVRRKMEKIKTANEKIRFIDERLAIVSQELNTADKEIEKFKTENDLTDIMAEAGIILEQTSINKASIVGLQTQLAVFDMICDFLEDPANRYSMIPVTSGVEYEGAAKSIETYNNLVLERTKLDMSAKKDNKALVTLNKQIDSMRAGVVQTLQKARESAEIAYNDFVREDSKYGERIRQLPTHERIYLSLMRDREVKNQLYIFLLQQRESNSLELGSAPLGRVIDEAYNEYRKVSPKGSILLPISLFLSLLLPSIFYIVRAVKMKKLRVSGDIEALSASSVALCLTNPESDVIGNNQEVLDNFRKVRNEVVTEGVTNIVITTANNYDNASFVATGLAKTLRMAAKRPLIIDVESNTSIATSLGCTPTASIVDYLNNPTNTLEAIVTHCSDFDIITSGTTGLDSCDILYHERFRTLIQNAQEKYDNIIICGNSFDGHHSLSAVSEIADSIIGIVSYDTNRRIFEEMEKCIAASDTKYCYIFYKKA